MSRSKPFSAHVLSAIISVLFVTGCGSPARPTPAPATLPIPTLAATLPPTQTASPTLEPTSAATATTAATLAPTATPTTIGARATVTQTASASSTVTATMKVKIFLVAVNDNGKSGKKIGCNDSLVAVDRIIPATTAPLTAALKELLSIHTQYYGQSGLYDSLYQSRLSVTSVALADGKATIHLSGTYKLGGACDNPRFSSQITETALQFPTVKQVAVFINGISLDTILSSK